MKQQEKPAWTNPSPCHWQWWHPGDAQLLRKGSLGWKFKLGESTAMDTQSNCGHHSGKHLPTSHFSLKLRKGQRQSCDKLSQMDCFLFCFVESHLAMLRASSWRVVPGMDPMFAMCKASALLSLCPPWRPACRRVCLTEESAYRKVLLLRFTWMSLALKFQSCLTLESALSWLASHPPGEYQAAIFGKQRVLVEKSFGFIQSAND